MDAGVAQRALQAVEVVGDLSGGEDGSRLVEERRNGDDRTVGNGKPGALSGKLRQGYLDYAQERGAS